MERFTGEVVAHEFDHDKEKKNGKTAAGYFIQPHSAYVRAVTQTLSDARNRPAENRSLLRADAEVWKDGQPVLPELGSTVDFTFDESDLLTAVSVVVVQRRNCSGESGGNDEGAEGEKSEAEDEDDCPSPPRKPSTRSQSAYAETQCPICLETLSRPSTLKCGHSFCLHCLTHSLLQSPRSLCPTCRSPNREPLAINITLRDAIKRLCGAGENDSPPTLPCEVEQSEYLRYAVREHRESCLLNLLLCGYDPDAKLGQDGNNALGCAAQLDFVDMARILLEHGADVDVVDSDGDTALMNAAYFRRPKMASFLLKRGADPTLLSESGLTASAYAQREGFEGAPPDEELARTLIEAEVRWAAERQKAEAEADVDDGGLEELPTPPRPRSISARVSSTEAPLTSGPRRMRVEALAPMVRSGPEPDATPVGRLARGDEVTVTAYDRRGGSGGDVVVRLRFAEGPAGCPEGWVPAFLPTSQTQILVDIEEQVQQEGEEEDEGEPETATTGEVSSATVPTEEQERQENDLGGTEEQPHTDVTEEIDPRNAGGLAIVRDTGTNVT